MTKYIFITGGVVSGLGKGIAAASIGLILKSRGLSVVNQKFDPYLNIDPGTMNPFQHGEVFVTDDGAETDLDLGHYERFTDATLSQSSNTTAGRVYLAVLNREREGGYHGGTVQVIPNVTEEILTRMLISTKETNADVIITEIGGTVGDIESLPFIEAIRQMKYRVGEENCCYIHLTLLPYLSKAHEIKTKPTQHSVKELQELGIQPNILMLRTETPLDDSTRERLAQFCNVDTDCVIQNLNAKSIYEVPLNMEKEGLGSAVCKALGIADTESRLGDWAKMVDVFEHPKRHVKIALVGKYIDLHDAYLSVVESLTHGGIANEAEVSIDWIDSETLSDDATVEEKLGKVDGIIVPGGFGSRGIEGMVRAAKYARTHKVPYFGICLGMQILVIEYARNVLGWTDAHSTEIDKNTTHPVIDLMPDQNGKILGGTLRLGKFACKVEPGTLTEKAYRSEVIWERHRHRYEFNNVYREELKKAGLIIAGVNPERDLVEICEVPDHPWMLGGQFHPEFKSRPNKAGPLFRDFIKASCEYGRSKRKEDGKGRSKILVLDFGSQYAHLIAKRLRMLGYYSEIALPSVDVGTIADVKGIILSGGPASVYDENVPECNPALFDVNVPILGLCYGHQLMARHYGGTVGKATVGEFGIAHLNKTEAGQASALLSGVTDGTQVWMSHQDAVLSLGEGFEVVASTKDCPFAAVQDVGRKRYSLQCHCEVKDTLEGNRIFENFARDICGMERNWDEDTVLAHILEEITSQAAGKNVLLFLSGGVDSTVAFALLNKALGQERVLGLHIDNGFMRKDESAQVAAAYRAYGFTNFIVEDAHESFLAAVAGLTDPQKKRMAVGENFIAVRNEVVSRQKLEEGKWLLAQGTLYPDIIESGGTKNSKVIKTHHNRVDGIQKLIEKGLVIEPLRDLYKDEVRVIGRKLGLDAKLVMRHPFPGPGLSINVLCTDGTASEKDKDERAKAQQELDSIKLDMFCAHCTQALSRYVLPVRSVGVQGDFRTYRFPAVLSFAAEENGFYHLPKKWEKLEEASSRVTNNATYINRCIIRLWQNPALSDGDLRLQQGYCDKRRLDQTRDADDIMLCALHESGWYDKVFQHLTINLPYASAQERCSFVLRPLCSEDVMTARFAQVPQDLLKGVIKKIAGLPYVDAIFFDLSNKPPATFGWE